MRYRLGASVEEGLDHNGHPLRPLGHLAIQPGDDLFARRLGAQPVDQRRGQMCRRAPLRITALRHLPVDPPHRLGREQPEHHLRQVARDPLVVREAQHTVEQV